MSVVTLPQPPTDCEIVTAAFPFLSDCCNNPMVSCDAQGVSVTGLDIEGRGLTTIPTSLSRLKNLINLNLSGNNINSEIPSELSNLTNLNVLSFCNNRVQGSLPTELGRLTNLTLLNVFHNQISGSIPTEFGNFKNIQFMAFFENNLRGPIPTELGGLTKLTYLSFFNNKMNGSIPSVLGNLKNLEILRFNDNGFTGSIPTEITSLTKLTYLDFGNNLLNGTIPLNLSSLTSLVSLSFGNNSLKGDLNDLVLPVANQLTVLDLSQNHFTGSIPKVISDYSNLNTLKLQSNLLNGTIPMELTRLNLKTLLLNYNLLSGDIPSNFSTKIASVDFSVNCLNGQYGGQRNTNCIGGGTLSSGLVAGIAVAVVLVVLGSISFVFYRRWKLGTAGCSPFGRGGASGDGRTELESTEMLPLQRLAAAAMKIEVVDKKGKKKKDESGVTLMVMGEESVVAAASGTSNAVGDLEDTSDNGTDQPNEYITVLCRENEEFTPGHSSSAVLEKEKPSPLFEALQARLDDFLIAGGGSNRLSRKDAPVANEGSSDGFSLPFTVGSWTAITTRDWILHNGGRPETARLAEAQTINGQVLRRVNIDALVQQLQCTLGERVMLEDALELLERIHANDRTRQEPEQPPAYEG
ncbi:hypothetical protein BDR26DRAFT_862961 [Obelidium mucronatum]|nr:hypothetical protein BDR26DRAFT_862961 [Obelidium mucronatum]